MADEEVLVEHPTDQGSQDLQEVSDHHDHGKDQLKGKKLSWQKLRRYDSLDLESRSFTAPHGHASKVRLHFLIVEPKDLNVFRCVARYGYTDVRNENEPFEVLLVEKLKEFIKNSFWISQRNNMHSTNGEIKFEIKEEFKDGTLANDEQQDLLDREIEAIDKAWRWGVVHLIGENEVTAAKGAGLAKRILIDYAYNILKRNLRQSDKVFDIPHKRMLKVGMTYEI
ncbi:potassium transporter 5-like [Pyrus ussuriensis x Pyrus communis]|uniref:Potassium transporter 5-like n=1 Tax=Pyrus ussuriensis x Pyrus communis TaxID=2448454 RepID=A0A5N5GLL9_9ROSA|nr:potassium transporter 5-like [Pyrus ussuriensis x Pyrus communis]